MIDTYCSKCGLDTVRVVHSTAHCTNPVCGDYQDVPR